MVDLADIGLMNSATAAGRRRLKETINHLSDVIRQGLTGTVGNFSFTVTSLRKCASADGIHTGCSNGKVLATGPQPVASNSDGVRYPKRIIYWLLVVIAVLHYYTETK